MRFFSLHAGKGTLGVGIGTLLLAWPPALSWLAAILALAWAAHHLRQSFRLVDAAGAASFTEIEAHGRELAPVANGEVFWIE